MSGEVKFYRTLILRRMPAMLFLLLLSSALGIAAAVRLPTVYSASARLIIEAPQIPNNLASTTVQVAPSQEIELIRQQLMTRANLLEIENKFRCPEGRGNKVSRSDYHVHARQYLRIQASGAPGGRRGGQQPTLLTVSFRCKVRPNRGRCRERICHPIDQCQRLAKDRRCRRHSELL